MLMDSQDSVVKELTHHVMAADLELTYFASREGKDSHKYQGALKSFATAWYILKQNRREDEFLRDVQAC